MKEEGAHQVKASVRDQKKEGTNEVPLNTKRFLFFAKGKVNID